MWDDLRRVREPTLLSESPWYPSLSAIRTREKRRGDGGVQRWIGSDTGMAVELRRVELGPELMLPCREDRTLSGSMRNRGGVSQAKGLAESDGLCLCGRKRSVMLSVSWPAMVLLVLLTGACWDTKVIDGLLSLPDGRAISGRSDARCRPFSELSDTQYMPGP